MKTIKIEGYNHIEVVQLIEKKLGGSSTYKRGENIIESHCNEEYYEFDKKQLGVINRHLVNLRKSIKKLRQITKYGEQ